MEYKIQDDDADEIAELRSKYLELNKRKEKSRFSIPYKLRWPIVWILFFSIVGIIQQSIEGKKVIFGNFFWRNYIEWFNSFGNFVGVYQISGWQGLGLTFLTSWYYLFFTGGLISLLIAIISFILDNYKTRGERRFFAGNV